MSNPMPEMERIATQPEILDAVVGRAIHDADQMFAGNEDHYFGCGRQAVSRICGILATHQRPAPTRILDFACGYGRVARYLRAAFPDAELCLSDLMVGGVEFCAAEFAGLPQPASPDASKLDFDAPFSLIWSGSLLTHLDEDKARDVLQLFERSLEPGGIAIFTTHGRYVASRAGDESWPYNVNRKQMEELAAAFWQGRFGYTDYSRRKGYGISTTPFSWVMEEMPNLPSLRVASFVEQGWDEHQDIVALLKVGP